MNTPHIFKLDFFILTEEILNREYVVLSEAPVIDTVTLLVSEFTSILQNKYEIIKVTDENISTYSAAIVGKYVLSWINSPADIKLIFLNNQGEKISVQYVNHEEEEIISQEINKEDSVDWDI